jgi:hypothetical protein
MDNLVTELDLLKFDSGYIPLFIKTIDSCRHDQTI